MTPAPPREIRFFAPGVPAPGGSKTLGKTAKGTPFLRSASTKTRPWMNAVAKAAEAAMGGRPPMPPGPIYLAAVFIMPRPKKHYRTGRYSHMLRDDAPEWHTVKPDRTKLLRSTEDALKGIVWADDSSVCAGPTSKRYAGPGEAPGAHIHVQGMTQ